jgi:hypothetical protein
LTKLLPILEMETMEDEAMEHRNGTHLWQETEKSRRAKRAIPASLHFITMLDSIISQAQGRM